MSKPQSSAAPTAAEHEQLKREFLELRRDFERAAGEWKEERAFYESKIHSLQIELAQIYAKLKETQVANRASMLKLQQAGLGPAMTGVAAAMADQQTAFAHVKLFSNYLTPDERIQVAKLLIVRQYNNGDVIVKQGDPGYEFFIIKEGEVEVTVEMVEGQIKKQHLVNRLKPGDYFGEQALIAHMKRMATVTAVGPVACWVLGRDAFQKTFGNKRMFGTRVAISAEAAQSSVAVRAVQAANLPSSSAFDKKKDEKLTHFLISAVDKNVLFAYLSKEQKKAIVSEMYRVEVKKGVHLINEGEIGDVFYVVESGSFDMTIGKRKVGTRNAGESFGELALMYGTPRSASALCTNDARLWAVNRFTFREVVAEKNKQMRDVYSRYLDMCDHVALLKDLSAEDRRKVIDAIEEVTFKKGSVIMRQGETKPAGGTFYMYILIEGECSVEIDKKEVRRIGPGSYFGELALLNDEPRGATITAIQDSHLFALSAESFRELTQVMGTMKAEIERHKGEYKEAKEKKAAIPPTPRSEEENIPLNELQVIKILGKGAFGIVKLVKHKKTGKTYALKAVWKKQIVDTQQQSHVMSEKRVMAMLKFPFLTRLYATYRDKHRLYFLLEVCLGGELFSILRARQMFPESVAKFYAASVVLAFEYMHDRNIIYRDLKPENLLLDAQGYLKVTDFGFAKELVNGYTFTLCGTPDYLAPEIVSGKPHGKAVDWWTLGIFIFEMLASYPPFYDEEPMKTYQKIMEGKVHYPPHFSKESINLISKLLEHKPTKRLGVIAGGASMIKAHPWFKGFDWQALYEHNAQKLPPPIVQTVINPEDGSNFMDVDVDELNLEKQFSYKGDDEWSKDFASQ